MPLLFPGAAIRRLQGQIGALAKPGSAAHTSLLKAMVAGSNEAIRAEFSRGVSPEEDQWDLTVRKRLALISRKLPSAIGSRLEGNAIWLFDRLPRDWMRAHQEGHEFPPRKGRAALQNKKGRFISSAQFRKMLDRRLSQKKPRKKRSYTLIGAHTVGRRVLPQRQILPENELPMLWSSKINAAVEVAIGRWAEKLKE